MIGVVAASLLSTSAPVVQEGTRSVVHLVEVARLEPSEARELTPPATDGIRFVFVAIRKAGFGGLGTLSETRYFELAGRRYPATNQASPEPITDLYDLAKFRQEIRRDLAERLPIAPDRDAGVLVVTIGGGELPDDASARVKLAYGWNAVTEDFWFTFTVPPRGAGTQKR